MWPLKITRGGACFWRCAVHLALIACDVGLGDEVLVQSITFCASSHPITYLGAIPVFIDSKRGIQLRIRNEIDNFCHFIVGKLRVFELFCIFAEMIDERYGDD